MRYLFIPGILFLVFLSSCDEDCVRPTLDLEFDNFDSAAASIVVIKQYAPYNNFATLLDTKTYSNSRALLTANPTYIPLTSRDSAIWYTQYTAINVSKDWTIEFPVINKVYKLQDLSYGAGHQPWGDVKRSTCVVGVYYTLDGVPKFKNGGGEPGAVTNVTGYIQIPK